ncbi:MAG: acyltransferase [Thermoplasmata archaeon]
MSKKYKKHPSAYVEEGAEIGDNTSIWHFVHVREKAKIGENCNLGKDVYIDTEVEIGDNVKIQNGVSVYKGVTIEDDVFLGPHMTFTNDRYPRANSRGWDLAKTLVKKGASIGAHATIISGVTIGEYAMVGAGTVVTKDVPDFALVMGNPAVLKGFVCYCGRKLDETREEDEESIVCSHCGKEVKINRKFRTV